MNFAQLDDMQRTELWAALALSRAKGIGAAMRKKLCDRFGSPYGAVRAAKQWSNAGLRIKTGVTEAFADGTWRAQARRDWESIKNCSAGILLYTDPMYPVLLKETPDAPLLLFYLGDASLLANVAVAVVGARDCTPEGINVAVGIVRQLSAFGVTVISGLARGIDRAAHFAALDGVGSSIAVLGSGIDVPSPRSNEDLYEKMMENGLLLSEFMPGMQALPPNFPVRNRIISGLSRAVLVVEAGVKSGTLITARHAIEQNRDVYAVPGSTLADTSEGCRDLIRRGAKVVFSAEDILLELAPLVRRAHGGELRGLSLDVSFSGSKPESLAHEQPKPESAPEKKRALPDKEAELTGLSASGMTQEQIKIISLLHQKGSCHIEEIADLLDLDMAILNGTLALLEVQGLIARLPGMRYIIQP